MIEASLSGNYRIDKLPCNTLVYRAILKKRYRDEEAKTARPEAFLVLRGSDADGLSVNVSSKTSLPDWVKSFNNCYGVASIHVGRIRDLSLDVKEAPEPDNPAHALITGIPHDDRARMEFLAGELAKISRLVV